jgi:RNA polymerase sigma factor (sigma-70 family)
MAFTTRRSLLSKIREGDEIGWNDFYQTYRPLIFLRGGDFNLSQSEKEELIQDTVLSVFKGQKTFNYDPARGKFRTYLRTIISHRAIDIKRKRKKNIANEEDINFDNMPESKRSLLDASWDAEWSRHVLKQSMEELKNRIESETYQAFELYIIEEWAPQRVADFLDMKVGSVYTAKNRATEKLRAIIKEQQEL